MGRHYPPEVGMFLRAFLVFACCAFEAVAQGGPAARVEQMAWLQGYWEAEGLGGQVQETWMPPRDGVMLGAFRLSKPDRKGFYELFAIEEHEGSLRFAVKHFHPDWVGWEEKDRAQLFPLTRIAEGEAEFRGFVFRRESADAVRITFTITMKDGRRSEQSLRLTRRKL
jgi:hypothetical protein